MKSYIIMTGTVTYAVKGRDILRKNGIKATVERSSPTKDTGCGYGIVISGGVDKAQALLSSAGVKVLKITETNR